MPYTYISKSVYHRVLMACYSISEGGGGGGNGGGGNGGDGGGGTSK